MKTILISLAIASVFSTQQKPEKSISNLEKAYQAEANAARKYEMYEKKASEEGYDQVAKLFRAISKSESIHMKNHAEAIVKLGAEPKKIVYKDVTVKTTKENLKEPLKAEKNETDRLYPKFIQEAIKENAKPAEKSFRYAMEAEAQHEKLLSKALHTFGKNEQKNYYVSNITGETIEEDPAAEEPMAKLPREKYIKF
jgi:rubrerythrin